MVSENCSRDCVGPDCEGCRDFISTQIDKGEAVNEIIGCFTRNVIYTERQRNDGLLSSVEWSHEIFKHEEWLKSQILSLPSLIAPEIKEGEGDE